jgi:hypothetical protein
MIIYLFIRIDFVYVLGVMMVSELFLYSHVYCIYIYMY